MIFTQYIKHNIKGLKVVYEDVFLNNLYKHILKTG